MKHTTMTRLLRRSALVVALLGLLAGTASAQTTYYLAADVFEAPAGACDAAGTYCESDADCTAPDVCVLAPMWGFVEDDMAGSYACGTGGPWDFGPDLMADAAGTTASMTVRLRNCLTEPVSIVIPGQPLPAGSTPRIEIDGAGRSRAASFTSEALASDGTTATEVTYNWTGLKPGTYLYHSGTDVGTQVHMGLYGAAVVSYNGAQAYPGIAPDVSLLFVASEIDPALHSDSCDLGTSMCVGSGNACDSDVDCLRAKPLNYKPKYFLVNGRADGETTVTGPAVNQTVLLRIVNAGLTHYVPNLLGEDLEWVAEDGNKYEHPKTSYSALLAAGKTMDALWTPVTDGPHYLYDRRLHLSSNGAPGGGLIAEINVAVNPAAVFAIAGPDQQVSVYSTPPTTPPTNTVVTLAGSASGGTGPYTYQWSFVGFPGSTAPSLSDPTDPAATFSIGEPGAYTLQLVATDSTPTVGAPDTVSIVTNLPPVAAASADPTAVEVGQVVQLFGGSYCAEGGPTVACTSDADCTAYTDTTCVIKSYDPDGDDIDYAWSVNGGSLTPSSTTANPTWTFAAAGTYSATLTVTETGTTDLLSSVPPATVQVTVSPAVNDPPVAIPDFYTVNKNSIDNVFDVTDNDDDPELGNAGIDVDTIDIKTPPTNGGSVSLRACSADLTFACAVDADCSAPTAPGGTCDISGTVLYSPRRGWRGTDYFTYTVKDTSGAESNVASVVVNVVQ